MAEDAILVAGGGIAGLAAALGLARTGRVSRVLERSARFEEAGAGIQIGPNAVKALIWLGAWEALRDQAFAPKRILVRDGVSARVLQDVPLGDSFERRFGEPYRVAHRSDLLLALLDAVKERPQIEIEAGSEVTACLVEPRAVRIECAGGSVHRGPALIGADGIHSFVRAKLFEARPSRPPGQVLYRALIPVFGGLPEEAADSVCLWLCPGGHVVHYPVRGGTMLNIVAAVEREYREGEPLSDDVLAAFARACEALRLVLALPNRWRSWPGADRRPRPGWSRGRVTLIGDAAHPALPYLAQGAAMALEDACALARADDFPHYEKLRYARTARIQSASRRLARVYHAQGMARNARNAVLRALSPERFLGRMAWIYRYDPVAQT
jgi:salicylate hydroxylase